MISRNLYPRLLAAVMFAACAIPGAALADPSDDDPPLPAETESMSPGAVAEARVFEEKDTQSVIEERVRVTGSPAGSRTIPGSVTYFDREFLERQDYADVHRVLSQVPGVHFREEDGYGLRPNIGMRGSGSERSSKITLMEDGVLIAPAPYAAPSAYYFPTMGRMEGVEVRKGSASVEQGPITTGGVLNLLSSSIPGSFDGRLNLAFGDNETLRGGVKIGDSSERFGWLFETYQQDTAGFKRLDTGGETGFDLEDYLLKLRFTSRPGDRRFQAIELKLGKTDQVGHQTYVGLTDADFAANPFRRYAGSAEDRIDSEHEQFHARYFLRVSPRIDFTATAYRNDFSRNWRKLQSVNGTGLGSILSAPGAHGAALDVLTGELSVDSADDALMVRNNRRDYYSQGVQAVIGLRPRHGATRHDIEIGIRHHEDEEDRFQEEDGFRMAVGGIMQQTSVGIPGSQSNRVNTGESLALFVKDTIRSGRWALTPGVRFESIDFERRDYVDASRTISSAPRRNALDVWIPGIGVSYELSAKANLFGGVHRGFAPPGPGTGGTRAEDSTNYEFGYRREAGGIRADVVGFFSDYSNLLGACTISSGCLTADVGESFDGGQVDVRGLEVSLIHDDVTSGRGAGFRVPLNVAYTLTSSEFKTNFDSDYEPWGRVEAGFEVPYLPRHQLTVGAGLVHDRFSAHLNAIFVDRTRTVAGRGPIPAESSTDAHTLIDLSLDYRWTDALRFFVHARNLTDEVYVAARRPAGVRPGIDRTVLAGLTFDF